MTVPAALTVDCCCEQEPDAQKRCSPPAGVAEPLDRDTLFDRTFEEFSAGEPDNAAEIAADFQELGEILRAEGYNRSSILAIGQRPYNNPSLVSSCRRLVQVSCRHVCRSLQTAIKMHLSRLLTTRE